MVHSLYQVTQSVMARDALTISMTEGVNARAKIRHIYLVLGFII